MTIAKLRAARQLWARVAEVVGAADAGAATVHAVTSLPMMAQRDPWVNMLRTTLAAFGAGVGGADTVTVQPFDVAMPGGRPAWNEFRAAHRPQHPAAAARGIAHRPGARPGRRILVRRGPHQTTRRAGVGALPAASNPAAGSSRRADYVAAQIAEVARPPRRRHRAPAHRGHRCQRVPEPHRTPLPAELIRSSPVAPLRGRFRGAAGPLGCVPGDARVPAAGAAAAARPARRAQRPHHVRRQPARVGRHRGRQPRHVTRRRRRRCPGGTASR